MAEDRDPGVVLNVPNQLIGSTRYHEVDVFVKVEERGYDVSCGDKLYRGVWDQRVGQGLGYGDRDGLKRESGFFATCAMSKLRFRLILMRRTFKYRSISRLNGQRSYIGNYLGTCLEDNQQNSNWACKSFQLKAVIQPCS